MLEDNSEKLEADEYEEIHSEEVDRVIETLATLIESVESETIGEYLQEVSDKIFELVYDEEDMELEEEETDELEDEEYELDEEDDDEAMAA